MVNGQRHSLARIPLRWMIRECFKINSGIIFDAHMLEHEVGLDINSIFKAPDALSPATLHLAGPDGAELKGFSFRDIPIGIIKAVGAPFRWIWGKLSHLRVKSSPRVVFTLEQARFVSEGEANEELEDALSPIYDQLKKHTYWKIMEWIPCESSPSPTRLPHQANELIRRLKGSSKSKVPRWMVPMTSGPTSLCKSSPVVTNPRLRTPSLIVSFVSWNRGKGRKVYSRVMRRGVKVHRSVRTRMLARGKGGENRPYLPKIRYMIDGKPRKLTRDEWLAEDPLHFEWVD